MNECVTHLYASQFSARFGRAHGDLSPGTARHGIGSSRRSTASNDTTLTQPPTLRVSASVQASTTSDMSLRESARSPSVSVPYSDAAPASEYGMGAPVPQQPTCRHRFVDDDASDRPNAGPHTRRTYRTSREAARSAYVSRSKVVTASS